MNDAPEQDSESPFHLEPQKPGFETMGHENSFRFWWASELAALLGYQSLHSFRKAIERAMVTLTSLNVPIFENMIHKKLNSSHREIRKLDNPAALPAELPPPHSAQS